VAALHVSSPPGIGFWSRRVHDPGSVDSRLFARMPTLAEFNAQLERCAQSDQEVRDFVEAFSKVRLRYIARAMSAASPPITEPKIATFRGRSPVPVSPDWSDPAKLAASGLTSGQVAASVDPSADWLHIDVAVDTASGIKVAGFIKGTCLSDKQRRAIFPALSRISFGAPVVSDQRRIEVPRLNAWLAWSRAEGINPALFGDYQKHLRIHGASQNAGGAVGAAGGSIAVLDAIQEVAPGIILDLLGALPRPGQRDPIAVDTFLRQHGIAPESNERPLKCILLPNHRAVVFASDPDVAIIQSLSTPFQTAQEAWEIYAEVRSDSARRAQRLVEFAVGEIKAATDASNLHERLALGSRESRSERQTDRFLLMAILTGDLLTGGAGPSGRRNTRAPLQSREAGRFADIFNLHHAWGWDGGRERHPEHWDWLKRRLKEWCGI
jgi:hypothetical protein